MRGGSKPIHPSETIAAARSLWDEGHSTATIGKRLGVTKNVIVGLASRNDFPARPSPLKQMTKGETARNAKIVEAWNTGDYTMRELAAAFGVKPSYISNVLQTARKKGKRVWNLDFEARSVRSARAWQTQRAAA